MKASKRRIRNSEHKGEIREKYKGIDPSEIEVIPANEESDLDIENRKMKVAAYVRVSTQNDEQTSSFELQVNDFTKRINENPNWEFAGIYSDEGISGTELSHRAGMLSLIEDAKAGKVQLILVKSIARFARNVVDCLSIVQELKNYGVGVRFDENNLCTLGAEGTMLLTILATVAEEESRSKSFIMNWSVQRRFQNGIFLTPELLGYDNDEDGGLVINESEAETVKVIYYLYVNGWSSKEIADLLKDYQRETKLGNTEWKSSWITQIIDNERHCGDVLAHKTYTPDFKTHKAVKNDGKLPKYRKRDHHDAIISREVFNAAQIIRASAFYKRKKHALPVLSVVEDGALKGYVPIDRNWEGFSPEDYQKACESVQTAIEKEEYVQSGLKLNLNGYQRVSSHFFPSSDDLSLTISGGKMRFSTACLKKFEDVEYIELLINTVNNCIAIRPCESDNPNAIHWGRLKEDKWIVNSMDKLDILSAGDAVANPSELVASENMDKLLEKLEEKYTYIIIDTPAVNFFTDAVEIAKKVSGMIMVVRYKETSAADIDSAMSRIEFFEANMLGFIINDMKTNKKYNKFVAPNRSILPAPKMTDAQIQNKNVNKNRNTGSSKPKR